MAEKGKLHSPEVFLVSSAKATGGTDALRAHEDLSDHSFSTGEENQIGSSSLGFSHTFLSSYFVILQT